MQGDPAVKEFVSSLAENFKERFESSPKLSGDILLFLRQPFSVPADGEWTAEAKRLVLSTDEAALQMERGRERHVDVNTLIWMDGTKPNALLKMHCAVAI
ncbi:unnamed protein product [Boreogadus saida]